MRAPRLPHRFRRTLAGPSGSDRHLGAASAPVRSPHKVPIDPNGNVASRVDGADTWGYEWNARSELTRVLKNGVEQARFAYDPAGRRVEKVAGGLTTTYLYDSAAILRETQGGSALKYVHGLGTDEPLAVEDSAGLSCLHADGLGSTVAMTNAVGALVLTRRYDAWGNLQAGVDQAGYAFTGREWDPQTGLYYYRARHYDPAVGRFISEDPIRFGGGPNFYAYADNDPIDKLDPLGLSGWRWEWRTCVGQVAREVGAGYCGNGKNANDDPSCRVAHCMANCKITRECVAGRMQAAGMSYVKESWDWVKKKTWDPNSEGYSHGDQCANKYGRDQAQKQPDKTCEELCKNVR